MKKNTKKILLIIASLLFICSIILYFSLASIIKDVTLTVCPKVTGAKMQMESLSFSALSGSFRMTGFSLANPKGGGFSKNPLVKVKEFFVKIKPLSLLSDTIVVEKITIIGPEFSYEKNGLSSSNIDLLQKNITSFFGISDKKEEKAVEKPEGKKEETKKSKKLIIKHLLIKDGKVRGKFLIAKLTLALPNIDKENIGAGKSISETMKELSGIIFGGIKNVITSAGGLLKDGGGQLKSGIKSIGKGLKNTFKGIGEMFRRKK